MKKIKINKLPKGFHRMPDGTIMRDSDHQKMEAGGQPVLGPTPRSAANLEAEKGETVVTDLDNNNIPEKYNIGGKKHSEGGTPLNLPPKSFIFSDHRSMAIKGEELKKFIPGTSKKSMTPAQISKLKRFDMTGDNEVLKDENADMMAKATAERNIQSKLVGLGELAMAQESKKDFKDGIPEIALPFLKRKGVTPEQVEMINAEMEQVGMMQEMVAKFGKEVYAKGGEKKKLTKYQTRGQVSEQKVIKRDGKVYIEDPDRPGTYVEAVEVANKPGTYVPVEGSTRTIEGSGKRTIGNFTKDYSGLEQLLQTEEFAPLLDAAYAAYLQDDKDNFGGVDQNATKEDVLNALLKMQYQNYTFKENNVPIDAVTWDNEGNANENAEYTKAVEKLGIEPLTREEIARAQGLALTLSALKADPRFQNNELVQRLQFSAEGEEGALSNRDSIYGDNTARTFLSLADVEIEPEKEKIVPGEIVIEDTPGDSSTGPYPEDLINIGAVALTKIPREYGYTQRLQPFLPDPVFLDPERELQANQEVYNTAANTLALTGRSNQLAGNLSLLQGKMLEGQANTLAKYSNANSQIANQFELIRNDYLNKFGEYNAAQNRQQAIDTAVLNESYAAQRNQKLENMSEALNQASNNIRIQKLINDSHTNYSYDPVTGGVIFTGSGIPTPDEIAEMQRLQQEALANMPRTKEEPAQARYGGERFRRDLLKRFIK